MSFPDEDHENNLWVVDNHESGEGSYTGFVCKQTLLPNGQGCMKYFGRDNLISYDGQWDQGIWHGYGSLQFQSQDCYVGDFRNGSRDGNGTYMWQDGSQYEGQFSQDARTGKGVFTWTDGNFYKGDFVNGKREGLGQYKFVKTGDVYSGHWKDGDYDGFGVFTWGDGRSYRGNWKLSKRHGTGIESDSNGRVVYNGMWENHAPVEGGNLSSGDKLVDKYPNTDNAFARNSGSPHNASSTSPPVRNISLPTQHSHRTAH